MESSKSIPLTKSALAGVPDGSGWVQIEDKRISGLKLNVGAKSRSIYLRRRFNGQARDFRLAKWTRSLSPEQVRKLASEMDAKLVNGIDPSAARQKEKAEGVTLEDAFDRMIDILKHGKKPIKPSTEEQYRFSWKTDLAKWNKRPLSSITGKQVEALHRERSKTSPSRANKAVTLLRQIYRVAAVVFTDEHGKPIAPHNPTDQVVILNQLNKRKQRTGYLKDEQLEAWAGAVLNLSSRLGTEQIISDLFMFTLLSGLRRNEAAQLKWSAVDLPGKTFTIAQNKSDRPLTLPLSDYLNEILERRKAVAGNRQYVFPAGRNASYLSRWTHWTGVVTEASGVAFIPHDLRRTFITTAEGLDLPPYVLKSLVNHALPQDDVTAGYIQMGAERLRVPMQKITDRILTAAKIRETGVVVPFRATS
jgi:integrase